MPNLKTSPECPYAWAVAETREDRLQLYLRPFRPVPSSERARPPRRRTINNLELLVDRHLEHREAAAFLDQVMRAGHGRGIETIVRALLLYRDITTSGPRTGNASASKERTSQPTAQPGSPQLALPVQA